MFSLKAEVMGCVLWFSITVHTVYLGLGRKVLGFRMMLIDLPVTVDVGLSVASALSLQMENRSWEAADAVSFQ